MKRNKRKNQRSEFALPKAFPSDLRGRQSVRATFKLSRKAINALSIVSVHLGIKQKSLIDHLLEDDESLDLIAKEIRSSELEFADRAQKTFVLSRKTLACLDRTSKDFNTPRDALVEYSIQRLIPVIVNEREKHRKRKEILRELKEYLRLGHKILNRSKALLGGDDPITDTFESAMTVLSTAQKNMESFVEKGNIIEEF